MTSTGFLSLQQQESPTQTLSYTSCQSYNSNDDGMHNNNRKLLVDLVRDHHSLYFMEHRDRPNVVARVLVTLHELGASNDQLARVYDQLYSELTPLRMAPVHIDKDNWQEYLGNSIYYGNYLDFFDQQLEIHGLDGVVEQYLYNSVLLYSVGSQLQPLVHLAFGIEQRLPLVVTQGLAYLASTFLDVSELTTIHNDNNDDTNATFWNDEQLLFDLVGADRRFGGKIDGSNTFHSAVKVLLKSKSDLLKTYIFEWTKRNRHQTLKQRLDELVAMSVRLITYSSHQQHVGSIELDWFLGGGQLLSSALAIQTLINHAPSHVDIMMPLVNLQFLATLCTYIVQGRPRDMGASAAVSSSTSFTWEQCVATIVESADPKAILTLQALKKAQDQHPTDTHLYLQTVNFLAHFAQNGTWVKGGIGW
ncbi:hypothetical protein K492DRAFT_176423 [Lichtheimia hyalospora FSU 10163]|nr:hypothetical protein K492DRAFT_176423 [Lichtheimia hyalospora FSU 10163]